MLLEKVKADMDAGVENGELDKAKKTYSTATKKFIEAGVIPDINDKQWETE